jgi:hypothetical protein
MAERALALLSPDNLAMRARVSYILGLVQMSRARLEEAWLLMTNAWRMGRQSGDYWIGAGASAYMGEILWLRGRLREALEVEKQAVDLAGQSPAAAKPR